MKLSELYKIIRVTLGEAFKILGEGRLFEVIFTRLWASTVLVQGLGLSSFLPPSSRSKKEH